MKFKLLTVAMVSIAFIYLACNRQIVQGSIIPPVIITGWQNDSSLEKVVLEFDIGQRVIKEESANEVSTYRFSRDSIWISEFNKDEEWEVYTFKGKLDKDGHIIRGNSIAVCSHVT